MARTYRRVPHGKIFRAPRGRKQAQAQGARRKAVPPCAWDDVPIAARKEYRR